MHHDLLAAEYIGHYDLQLACARNDRQVVNGYDGPCIVADSQARAIYTTTGSLSQQIYDECLAPPVSTTEAPKGYQGFRYQVSR